MLKVVHDNIFSAPENILINPVNSHGHLGTLAAEFGKRFPWFVERYKRDCAKGRILANGAIFYSATTESFPVIACLDTMDGEEILKRGLQEIEKVASVLGYSIATPWVGCGVAGYTKEEIRPLLEKLGKHCNVTIYEVD